MTETAIAEAGNSCTGADTCDANTPSMPSALSGFDLLFFPNTFLRVCSDSKLCLRRAPQRFTELNLLGR